MFYLFHHMPKCGGTSFKKFLKTVFNLHLDYHPGLRKTHPREFQEYQASPEDLNKFTTCDCLAGHYNLPGVRLWERYPELEDIPHKKFCILRDPLETAKSGVKFGIRVGWADINMSKEIKRDLLLRRVRYFVDALGIEDESDAERVLDKYWFVAPLDKIDYAAHLIASEIGNDYVPIECLNTTPSMDDFFEEELLNEFSNQSTLDLYVYSLCVSRFNQLYKDFDDDNEISYETPSIPAQDNTPFGD
jgi:hypothetical protein